MLPPFFPTLVERFARDQLRAAAQVEGLDREAAARGPVRLRAQRRAAARWPPRSPIISVDDRVSVRCAGSNPGAQIYPVVAEAMSEIGLDVSQEFPKPLTDIVVRAADVVITMGCGDSCPIYPGKRYQDWAVADPAGQPIEVVRAIRDDIQAHVSELLETVTTVPAH